LSILLADVTVVVVAAAAAAAIGFDVDAAKHFPRTTFFEFWSAGSDP